MISTSRRLFTMGALIALAVVGLSSAAPIAIASGPAVPFTDTDAIGTLTFCSSTGQPVTSGSIYTAPFAWKAIASSEAPAGYRRSNARATLYAFQPIQYVAPGDWSGEQLTGSSSFSNSEHPVAQATNGDVPMVSFVGAYPPHWQGLVQIRMLFTAVNAPQHNQTYPAAVIRVVGKTWTLVSGGGTPCGESRGVSDESLLLPASEISAPETVAPVPASTATPSEKSSSKPSAGSTAGSTSASASASPAPSTTSSSSDPTALSDSSSGLGAGAKTGIGLGVIAIIGLGVGAIAWWRRRRSATS